MKKLNNKERKNIIKKSSQFGIAILSVSCVVGIVSKEDAFAMNKKVSSLVSFFSNGFQRMRGQLRRPAAAGQNQTNLADPIQRPVEPKPQMQAKNLVGGLGDKEKQQPVEQQLPQSNYKIRAAVVGLGLDQPKSRKAADNQNNTVKNVETSRVLVRRTVTAPGSVEDTEEQGAVGASGVPTTMSILERLEKAITDEGLIVNKSNGNDGAYKALADFDNIEDIFKDPVVLRNAIHMSTNFLTEEEIDINGGKGVHLDPLLQNIIQILRSERQNTQEPVNRQRHTIGVVNVSPHEQKTLKYAISHIDRDGSGIGNYTESRNVIRQLGLTESDLRGVGDLGMTIFEQSMLNPANTPDQNLAAALKTVKTGSSVDQDNESGVTRPVIIPRQSILDEEQGAVGGIGVGQAHDNLVLQESYNSMSVAFLGQVEEIIGLNEGTLNQNNLPLTNQAIHLNRVVLVDDVAIGVGKIKTRLQQLEARKVVTSNDSPTVKADKLIASIVQSID